MMRIYAIFAIVGWGWAAVVMLFLAIYRPQREESRGTEVMKRNES